MVNQPILFSRRYHAALLDYLLGAGETGLTRAYELGRRAVEDGVGLLPILQAHQRAINSLFTSTPSVADAIGRLQAAEVFLLEALSPFELTYRGYMAMLGADHGHSKD